ncbi:hypothetical protein RchiOBHm_Chr2g0176601 [Rosa chinensis]|uniref:Uncharacterized protein n=1 Tax=Rosa chinensis TaxID=74649 RepID=A0A2P6S6N7_ROSCH|nr:UPF0496 protein At3g19330 [Rosa chinensis]PRQ54360.1 hypothetical protein RchiOBHm_Chr2g0176601 [Rosa chinensis]
MSPSHPLPPSQSQGTSTSEGSPARSPLSHEYSLAVESTSYNEIWSKVHVNQQHEDGDEEDQLVLERVLQPNRQCVEEALRRAESNSLTLLVSDYFRHSEDATRLCLLLHRSVYGARHLYAPLHQLLDVFEPDSSLNQSQCSHALDIFQQFDSHDNPFPAPDSHNFDDTRRLFNDLKQQLDRRLRASRSKIRRIRRANVASAICLIGTAVGVVASAAAITAHALAAFVVAGPLCCSGSRANKEVAHMKQVDAAAKGTCVLNNDLATIDRLARRLHTAVEGDKLLIRLGLERGAQDKHPIQEVLKQLRKSHPNFLHLINELDQHICLCFNTVNRARSLLLQEIHNLQTEAAS